MADVSTASYPAILYLEATSTVFNHPVVVLDFETTGLNVEDGDRVTEVAAIRIERGEIAHRFQTLVNCEVRIPRSISNYTHITQNMIDIAPNTREVFNALLPFIGNDPVFAHNAAFDQRFFRAECERAQIPAKPRQFFCTLKLAQQIYPGLPNYALSPLARSLGIETNGDAHRAGPDAEVAAKILLKLAAKVCERHSLPFMHVSMLRDLLSSHKSAAA